MPIFHKRDIARLQLETAVEIFLTGRHMSAVITLAGAASIILDGLVRVSGREAFIDYAVRIRAAQTGHTPKRKSYAHHIDKTIGVIAHKHLSNDDCHSLVLDLNKLATEGLIRATADYVTLNGEDDPFIRIFYRALWRQTENRDEIMAAFAILPAGLLPK
jgi:hypothetical protein